MSYWRVDEAKVRSHWDHSSCFSAKGTSLGSSIASQRSEFYITIKASIILCLKTWIDFKQKFNHHEGLSALVCCCSWLLRSIPGLNCRDVRNYRLLGQFCFEESLGQHVCIYGRVSILAAYVQWWSIATVDCLFTTSLCRSDDIPRMRGWSQ